MGACISKNNEENSQTNPGGGSISSSTAQCGRCSNNNESCHCHPCSCFKWGKREGLIEVNGDANSSAGGGGRHSHHHRHGSVSPSSRLSDPNFTVSITPQVVDELVVQTLILLRTLVGNDQEAPISMVKLHNIAEHEDGWLLVVTSLVNAIPLEDALGPAVTLLILDDGPLPTKENATHLSKHLDLPNHAKYDVKQKRNICIVLGCLAEKLAGQNSIALLSDEVMKFLVEQLNPEVNTRIILFAIVALEKFALTSENKTEVMKMFSRFEEHPLQKLEAWKENEDNAKRQIGFCAQWSLDNIFLLPDRKFGYESVDNSGINVILNSYDVSEYLKISPNGLEARCDASSFESVRSTFQVDSGAWYYEVLIVTEGVMQIGWATKSSKFLNHEGYGIGDDEYSVAYDGCRQVMWHGAQSEGQPIPCWQPGDILGTYLDLERCEIGFFLNGKLIKTHSEVFKHTKSGFFAAGSFMSFQQCVFNFGSSPFKFIPHTKRFKSFNQYAKLGDECRVVLPRHLRLEYLRKVSVKENSCTLCFDHIANVRLLPCEHCGFCSSCADQLENCPLCRHVIENKITLYDT